MKTFVLYARLAIICICFMLVSSLAAHAQCREEINVATREKVHYHQVPLSGKHEYLRFMSSGEERIFSYCNKNVELVYHVQMFTEIRFTTTKGHFSLYATTSDRTRWQTNFNLSAPLTSKDMEKMKGVVKMEVLLPEDKRTFVFDMDKTKAVDEALICIH